VATLFNNIHIHVGRQTLLLQDYLYRKLFGFISPPECGSLVYSIVFVVVCWFPVYALYRKRIFLKI